MSPNLLTANHAASQYRCPDIASNPFVEATATGLDGVEPAAMFGPHATNEINWQAHNPATIVRNLGGMSLSLYTATGIPGALDCPTPNPAASGIEFIAHVSTLSFTQRAQQAAVPYYLDDYVFGTHTFAYWAGICRRLSATALLPRVLTTR